MPVPIVFFYGLVTHFLGLKVIRDISRDYTNSVFKKFTHLFTETKAPTSIGIPTTGIPQTYLRRYAMKG